MGDDALTNPFKDDAAHGWIQWKGTDVCMDIHCVCGELGHVDADFCYYVKCSACGRIYETNGHVKLHEISEVPEGHVEARATEVEVEWPGTSHPDGLNFNNH